MGEVPTPAEWYYVGHYGQLGPLTLEQVNELARDGVITPETFVWRPGMGEWKAAQDVPDLGSSIRLAVTDLLPPPVPGVQQRSGTPPLAPSPMAPSTSMASGSWTYLDSGVPKSDKNRVTGGLLNLIPGVGRFYLGYAAHGALQLITALFCGIGFVWSVIDGIYILMGGIKYDGYGRVIQD